MENIREGTEILKSCGIIVPGEIYEHRNYWLYPVLVNNPDEFCAKLNSVGVDAYRGVSQLNVVEPIYEIYEKPIEAMQMFEKLVYLPIHKNIPRNDIMRICNRIVSNYSE